MRALCGIEGEILRVGIDVVVECVKIRALLDVS
jgi:hypothetical protein